MTELKLIHDITKVCYHPLPAEWVAEVMAEDEVQGRLGECKYCPIALASARALQIPAGILDVTGNVHAPMQLVEQRNKTDWALYQTDSVPFAGCAFQYIEFFDSDEMSRWPETRPKRFHYKLSKTFLGGIIHNV